MHALARVLVGADPLDQWPLPLCWEGEQRQRGAGGPDDDESWWLSVDVGAIDPAELEVTDDHAHVTCPACLEWLRA